MSLVATQFLPDKPNADRMFDAQEWAQLNAEYRFTLDAAADDHGTNSFCEQYCSPERSFLKTDVSGHRVWLNPPFHRVKDFLRHYQLCKAKSPHSTSACIVLPDWNFDAEVQSFLAGMTPVRRYAKGTKLFSAPDPAKSGARKPMAGIPWSVTVYYDAPQKKKVRFADEVETPFGDAENVPDPAATGQTTEAMLQADDSMVVNGTLDNHRCRILLDTGASTNFIGDKLVRKRNLATTPVGGRSVQPGVGKAFKPTSQVCPTLKLGKGVALRFGAVNFTVAPLTLFGIDAIVGVDFMQRYDFVLHTRTGKVEVRQPPDGGAPVSVSVPKPKIEMCSALQFKRAVRSQQFVIAVTITSETDLATADTACADANYVQEVRQILEEYSDVFPDDIPDGVPEHRSTVHTIPLVEGAKPVAMPMYRLSQVELDEVKKQVTYLLSKGLIVPTTSPWAAPVLFAPKADGGLRMCIDYRALNKQTVKDRFPLPRTEDLLDRVGKAKFFSKLDLRSGYWQIPIAPEDMPKTAFRTRYGHFHWRVMPFGLTNAPACFQRMVNNLLSKYLDDFVVVYLDDILIYSETAEQHLEHIKMVLDVLRKERLYAKASKCEFFKPEVTFLGHVVANGQLKVDPIKVKAVQDWPIPTTVADLRSFLGMVNYFRRFIENHAKICRPLYELLNKNSAKEWTGECENCFNQLKHILTSAPVLVAPDFLQRFIVYTDASIHGLGAVLMQEREGDLRPIAYESRKLNSAEMNYPTHEQELLAVVHALRLWHCYLEGSAFTVVVRSDHKPLQHFLTQPRLSRRQVRWWELVHSYDFEVHYCKGAENIADALSRRPDHRLVAQPVSLAAAHMVSDVAELFPSALLKRCAKFYKRDPWFTPRNIRRAQLELVNSVYVTGGGQLVVPNDAALKHDLLHDAHDAPLAGHPGINSTLEILKRDYWWPAMAAEVHNYVRECIHCQRNKASNRKPAGLLHPIPVPTEKFFSVSMDLITDLPTTEHGCDSIVTFVDRLTKYVIVRPTVKTCTAADLANIYVQHIACKGHGLPREMLTDRDPRFMSAFFQECLGLFQTKHKVSTAFHPQTDGLTERYNRVVEDTLRHYVCADQTDWDEHLHFVEFAINNSVNASTGYSPYYLHNGYHPRLPLAWHRPVPSTVPAVADMMQQNRVCLQRAIDNLTTAQANQKKFYDTRHEPLVIPVNSYVLLSTKNLTFKSGVRKLHPRWCGPFKVIRSIRDVAYELDLPEEMGKVHPVFHVSLLKPFVDSIRHQIRPPPLVVNAEEEFEVEALLNHRFYRRTLQFLVRWKGYDAAYDMWLSETELQRNCKNLLADYRATHNISRQPTRKRPAAGDAPGLVASRRPARKVRRVTVLQ